MLSAAKAGLLFAAALAGVAVLCPLCGGGVQVAGALIPEDDRENRVVLTEQLERGEAGPDLADIVFRAA